MHTVRDDLVDVPQSPATSLTMRGSWLHPFLVTRTDVLAVDSNVKTNSVITYLW